MSDRYQFWRDALAGKNPPMHDGQLECGFYRLRSKNKQTGAISWTPVAVYQKGRSDHIVCMIGKNPVPLNEGQEKWTYFGRFPVSEDAWRTVVEDGGNWPDQDAIVAQQTERGIGDNSGAIDDIEALSDQIKAASEGKKAYFKITTTEQSERAQSLRARLLELSGQADAARKKISDPLYKQWKDNNDRWKPLIEAANDAAGLIKKANDAFLTLQLQEQRKAEAAAAESEMMEPEAAPAMPTQIRGAYGRAASAKPTWVIKEITDWDALYQHFKNSAAVKEALEKLAKAAVKDGDVPGVTREEVARTK